MSANRREFSSEELESIAKLPPEIAALADKYPSDIVNVAESWNKPSFPEGYVPKLVEVYYRDADGPDIFIMDGELKDFTPMPEGSTSIAVQIDDEWAYIQLEGKEILNRLGGVILPNVIVNPEIFLQKVSYIKNLKDRP